MAQTNINDDDDKKLDRQQIVRIEVKNRIYEDYSDKMTLYCYGSAIGMPKIPLEYLLFAKFLIKLSYMWYQFIKKIRKQGKYILFN